MLSINLKNAFQKILNTIVPPRCPSGFAHTVVGKVEVDEKTGNKYCEDFVCQMGKIAKTISFECEDYSVFDNEDELREIDEEIDRLLSEPDDSELSKVLLELEQYKKTIQALQENNTKAFQQGSIHGAIMERAKLYKTMATAKQLLLDNIVPLGINEFKIPQFIHWYETQRISAVNPKQDVITYNICKSIQELANSLAELQAEEVSEVKHSSVQNS